MRYRILMVILVAALPLIGGCSDPKAPPFSQERAFADLVAQCDFGPRNPESAGHAKAGEFLKNSLAATTEYVRAQNFTYYDSTTNQKLNLTNLIASYNPKMTTRVMLCAHWDTRPRAEKDPDSTLQNKPIIGANDGASGVAVLLEIGRLLKDHSPPIGVDIVLFDGEDYGRNGENAGWFLGSEFFASHLGGYRPRAAILLDMVGDKNLEIYREAYSETYSKELNDYIWRKASEIGSEAFMDSVKYAVLDDHISLISRRILAVDLIDFDYPYWHSQEDTPDKCSPESLEEVGRVVLQAIFDPQIGKF